MTLLPPVHTGDELNLDTWYIGFDQVPPSGRFRLWVRTVGLLRLSAALGIHRTTIHSWLTLTKARRVPTLDTAQRIIALSRFYPKPTGGPRTLKSALHYEDIFGSVEAKEFK